MKVLHVSYTDYIGGAGRAAYRIHKSLLDAGVDSSMLVCKSILEDCTISGGKGRRVFVRNFVRNALVFPLSRWFRRDRFETVSINLLDSNLLRTINESDADLIHLHWVNAEMLSIRDIGLISKPVVWTFHDMWPFVGAIHYSQTEEWRVDAQGSLSISRVCAWFDINVWVLKRKQKNWRRPIFIVAPSKWLMDCVYLSKLMCRWPVTFIPNALNTEHWLNKDKRECRITLGLPSDKKLVLFGAFGGIGDKRKGFDLLREALQKLPDLYPVLAEQVELVIFGQSEPFESGDFSLRTRYFGQLSDDFNLNILYSACDVFMLPSRQDNCPLTIQESLSSGTPVVAFRTTGAESLLVHKSNGYLADFGSALDLLNGIVWVLEGTESELSLASRNFAVNNFDSKIISKKYLGIYECVITDFIK